MFGRIAHRYDLLNRLFSLGVDRRWRMLAIQKLGLHGPMKLLDGGAGTGDMSLTAHRVNPLVETYLLDPAHEMLARADGKAGTIEPSQYVLIRGAAESIPFGSEVFDRFTVAFGIRNFADLRQGMLELHRVLKPGGSGAILEFTPDRSRMIDRSFRWYMRKIMTPLGGRISGESQAYDYLARTVQNFPAAEALLRLFRDVGFEPMEVRKLSMGIATLFILKRP